jgi:hypothetical protein
MPTARKNGCLGLVGSNLYYSGGYLTPPTTPTATYTQIDSVLEVLTGIAVTQDIGAAVYHSGGFYAPGTPVALQPVTPTYLEVYYGPAVAATASPTPAPTLSPTPAPTYAPCAVTAPTNGALGTCTSSLALGGTCQVTCNDGYGVSGPTKCSATGVLTAATCMTGGWTTRKAVPAMSYWPLQGAGTYGTLMYAYIAGAKFPPSPANRGEIYKYASTTDAWTSGSGPRMQATSAPGCRSGARDGRIGRAVHDVVCACSAKVPRRQAVPRDVGGRRRDHVHVRRRRGPALAGDVPDGHQQILDASRRVDERLPTAHNGVLSHSGEWPLLRFGGGGRQPHLLRRRRSADAQRE